MHVESNRTRTRVHLYCTHSISASHGQLLQKQCEVKTSTPAVTAGVMLSCFDRHVDVNAYQLIVLLPQVVPLCYRSNLSSSVTTNHYLRIYTC